uniref:DNA-directed RNA polymerase n=1 Tax=Sporolithon durum TaxID=48970 RepID=A0A141SCT5_9FLOR|nr:RNA polymerase beta'' subunit [Sporolithon durum]AMK96103.1 RNA polymerase beta'' subunit [Sporolithon durum]
MINNMLEPSFLNLVVDKNQLKKLIVWAFRNYGIARAANMADKLKDLGFFYATKAGISLSIEDLRIPPTKQELLKATSTSILHTDYKYKRGEINAVERFQKVIDTWNNASESLKKEVIRYFKERDPLNTIYMMAFSGARGNISQVRQLVGMRGLMSDPQGQIIDLPISSNFREGLTVTDYFISSYGARKGLVDTALRTADSGYLTRRLVDVAQDVIIREINCRTSKGIILEDMIDSSKQLISLEQSLIGRVLAENIVHFTKNYVIAFKNQEINQALAQKIINSNVKKVLVRSPVTCISTGSVCQLCYGWNLAHGRLVDLGEAVGIIAAQSIGEPGTQLTMRTFHTGGVFTGEFGQKILSPTNGFLKYPDSIYLDLTRTRYGEQAYLVKKSCKVTISNITNTKVGNNNVVNLSLSKGTLLLVNDKTYIEKDQVIAEYPLSNRTLIEKAQKSIVTDLSGDIYFTDLTVEEVQSQQHIIRSVQKGGLIWVLSGRVHHIPENADIVVSLNQFIRSGSVLAQLQFISKYDGFVRFINQKNNKFKQDIWIIICSQIFSNVKVYYDSHNSSYILKTEHEDRFILKIIPNQKLVNNQIIGNLISDVYKTKTGGIIKYLDLPISVKNFGSSNEHYDILGAGYVLWIAEETHEINKDIALLLVKHGTFVEAGTEIVSNVFAKNSGLLEVIIKDGILREIIIKPGSIYKIETNSLLNKAFKKRGFLRPGEKVIHNIYTDKLVYWEYIKTDNHYLLLIRPVIVYSIPQKHYEFDYHKNSFAVNRINLKLIRRIYFKDGERIRSVNGVELIKTHLIIESSQQIADLDCFMDLKFVDSKFYTFQLFIADKVLIKEPTLSNAQDTSIVTRLLIKNDEFVKSGQTLAKTEIKSNLNGIVNAIQEKENYKNRLLVVTDLDKRTFKITPKQYVYVKINDWVYSGDEIARGVRTTDSGRIIFIDDFSVVLRIGRPYLVSNGSTLYVDHTSLVQRGEYIASLVFERAKTGDIVQGLPKIEEILEARKKSESSFNSHMLLESKFRFYLNSGLSLYDATRLSIQEIQLLLVQEVQLVYQSQGVDIADKHIEVIVRQMMSKVKIENGGNTEYLPGEIIELRKIEDINQALSLLNKQQASYHPILLGITKASLNTDSFISAASFQETTKVLTEAAISGKLDWLKGLKENVIIGRLIPAGTGFNSYSKNKSFLNNYSKIFKKNVDEYKHFFQEDSSNFEDIILDDRSARNFPLLKDHVSSLQANNNIL